MANAKLFSFNLVSPGGSGLNKQMAGTLLGPQWATQATNCVFDDSNRLAARKGWSSITATPIGGAPAIGQIFEYIPLPPTLPSMIASAQNKLYVGTNAPADITGAVVITANNWKFCNFNGNCYGLQASHSFIQYTGAGNFTVVAIASGSAPTGNEIISAYGRVWAVNSDQQTIQYSALLDATRWAGVDGGGSINLNSVWPSGADQIVALAAHNGRLVVFGKHNVVIYGDNTGSIIGVNPNNLVVVDAINGIGCIARDSVKNIQGEDLVFLGDSGLYSLNRMLVQRSNPLRNLSANVRDYVKTLIGAENVSLIRSAFLPRQGFYIVSFPSSPTVLCFDTKINMPDGTWRVTEWNGNYTPTSLWATQDGNTLYQGKAGSYFLYANYSDNNTLYTMQYTSGWLEFGPEVSIYIKSLKLIQAILSIQGTVTVNFQWGFDFNGNLLSTSRSTTTGGAGGEYNIAQYGIDEYGGGFALFEFPVQVTGSGQFIQVGLNTSINGNSMAIQLVQLFAKIGRMI